MHKSKKKKIGLGFGGAALGFMALFALKGSGGGTTPPPGATARAWFAQDNEEVTHTFLVSNYVGDQATNLSGIVFHAEGEEVRLGTIELDREYYIYAQGRGFVRAMLGTEADNIFNRAVDPANSQIVHIYVNGANVGTKTTWISGSAGSGDNFNLIARIEFQAAPVESATLMLSEKAFT